ncbi:MAG TPA: thioesterase family protein [Candidatus Margulisiibacteriota bacterium]|nr:thioesterase family protein [Candidatus Margulisiibacteriota bacterium]
MKKKIYYHDTDCGGVVYYANYLKYLEEARTELFADKGVNIKEWADKGALFVVARQEIDYKAAGRYADTLDIKTWVSEISGVRLNFDSEIKNQEGALIAKAKTILVCVDAKLKPQAIPDEIRKAVSSDK